MDGENNKRGRHKTQISIRFADMDIMGHVNNANYLTYMESARIKYFNDVIGDKINWSKNGFILARAVVDFISPIHLRDEEIIIYTKCSKIGNKSFDLSYTMVKSNIQGKVAGGITTLVAYDYGENKTIPIPEEWKEKIIEFENCEDLYQQNAL